MNTLPGSLDLRSLQAASSPNPYLPSSLALGSYDPGSGINLAALQQQMAQQQQQQQGSVQVGQSPFSNMSFLNSLARALSRSRYIEPRSLDRIDAGSGVAYIGNPNIGASMSELGSSLLGAYADYQDRSAAAQERQQNIDRQEKDRMLSRAMDAIGQGASNGTVDSIMRGDMGSALPGLASDRQLIQTQQRQQALDDVNSNRQWQQQQYDRRLQDAMDSESRQRNWQQDQSEQNRVSQLRMFAAENGYDVPPYGPVNSASLSAGIGRQAASRNAAAMDMQTRKQQSAVDLAMQGRADLNSYRQSQLQNQLQSMELNRQRISAGMYPKQDEIDAAKKDWLSGIESGQAVLPANVEDFVNRRTNELDTIGTFKSTAREKALSEAWQLFGKPAYIRQRTTLPGYQPQSPDASGPVPPNQGRPGVAPLPWKS